MFRVSGLEDCFSNQSVTESNITTQSEDCEITWEQTEQLCSNNVISSLNGVKYIIKMYDVTCIAKIKFAVFPHSDVSYIHWFRVMPKYQGNGLGTNIWSYITEKLGSTEIYSKIVNPALQSIAEKTGYIPDENLKDCWYVKKSTK